VLAEVDIAMAAQLKAHHVLHDSELPMPAEMTIHAIAFGSAFSFIAAVLAKLL
jgi:hypothetical protein